MNRITYNMSEAFKVTGISHLFSETRPKLLSFWQRYKRDILLLFPPNPLNINQLPQRTPKKRGGEVMFGTQHSRSHTKNFPVFFLRKVKCSLQYTQNPPLDLTLSGMNVAGVITFYLFNIHSHSTETNDELLWTRWWTFGLHKLQEISWLLEDMLVSQVGLCSTQLLINVHLWLRLPSGLFHYDFSDIFCY